MNPGFLVAVVLIAGLVVLTSLFARKRGYSHNQRVVLSGVAIVLLILAFLPRDVAGVIREPGKLVVIGLGVAVLIAAVRFLNRQS